MPVSSPAPHRLCRVLIVSKEASLRRDLARTLMSEHEMLSAEDEATARSLLSSTSVDVLLFDAAGFDPDLPTLLLESHPALTLVLLTDLYPNPDTPWPQRLFLTLPRSACPPESMAQVVHRAQQYKQLTERIAARERQPDRAAPVQIVGSSRAMDPVFELAHAAATCAIPVLLVGEKGTGKETLARAIHHQGHGASGPLVVVECTAMAPESLTRELFGPLDSALRPPLAVAAHEGTLLLANIESLTLESQAQLVRLLQYGEIAADQAQPQHANVRVMATTTQDLRPLVRAGTFRQDLLIPLKTLTIRIPPLRQRPDDIPLLAYHFVKRHADRMGRAFDRISPDALRILAQHRWPDNVRELEAVMARAAAFSRGNVILPSDIARAIERAISPVDLEFDAKSQEFSFDPGVWDLPYSEAKEQARTSFDRQYVQQMMRRAGGNISEAARQSGLDRSNFRRIMRKTADRRDDGS
ncbi:MAG TPA: sigma-54 dependent transcriptional regulator [Polyangiaceae bacterium]|nr:sigma-54 dependent transcriptional regulator [Polyangiaceae bacterium]